MLGNRRLYTVVCLSVAVLGVAGCGTPTLSTDEHQWTNLDAGTRLSLVKSEFRNLHYEGTVSANTVVEDVNNFLARESNVGGFSIKFNVDSILGSDITLQEEDKLSNEDGNVPKQINELKRFIASYSGGKMLRKLNDTSDINDLQAKLKQLTAQLKQDAHKPKQLSHQSTQSSPTNGMDTWEGNGAVAIAVPKLELKQSTELHTAGSGMTFVYVYADVLNTGLDAVQANPQNFTLSTPYGQTAPVNEDTYNVSNYLSTTMLNQNQQTGGWLVFYMPKSSSYTLNYNDFTNTAQKLLTP